MLKLQVLAAFTLLISTGYAALETADLEKDVAPITPPQPPAPPDPPSASSSTTIDADAESSTTAEPSSTTQTSSSIDISSLIASLSSDLTATNSHVDTSAIIASLSAKLTVSSSTPTTTQSSTSASSSTSSIPFSSSTGPATPGRTDSASVSPASSSSSHNHKTRTIILATVLSTIGFLVCVAAFLFVRYRRGQSPFSRLGKRGATPIDDDEIATWRGNSQAMAQTNPSSPGHNHTRTASSIIFTPSLSHTWTVPSTPSPGSTRSGPTSAMPSANNNANRPPNSPPVKEPASVVARAPNSRFGLTDETIPGADPFIPPLKRQSTRLSKAPSGHNRTKSRRSSRGSAAPSMNDRPGTGNDAGVPGLGRFSFDRTPKISTDRERTKSFSQNHSGGALGNNPFGGAMMADGPWEADRIPGGLSPPPRRKASFPDATPGLAS